MDDDEDALPAFVPMLVDMLHYGTRVNGHKITSIGRFPPTSHTATTASWDAANPTPLQTDPKAVEALPGVFVNPAVVRASSKRARKDTFFISIPPSIVAMMREHSGRRHGRGGNPVLYSPVSDNFVMNRAINNAVKALSVQLTTSEKKIEGRIPVSGASHNDGQLVFGRVSIHHPEIKVPPCCYGAADDDCSVSHLSCSVERLPARREPLQMYLTPEEQREFDSAGTLPDLKGPCFPCICRNVMTYVMLGQNDPNPEVGRYTLVPPFTVPINQHDGYNAKFCVLPSAIIAAHIPTALSGLFVEYNPEKKVWRVNQNAILWSPNPSPLN
jgi:hypothetical protein